MYNENKTDIFEFIVNRIVALRQQKGVSARDMSLSLGQNPNYINKIEKGQARPSLDGLQYICDYFGFTYFEFFHKQIKHPLRLQELMDEAKELDEDALLQLIRLAQYFNEINAFNNKKMDC